VEKLLAGLRAPDRLLMRMIYLDGLTLDEVAQLTGWNATVIKVRSFRARAQLRKRYRLLMKESP
jgi:DNA-directed RNA polymerase specialized sigma24 family protein